MKKIVCLLSLGLALANCKRADTTNSSDLVDNTLPKNTPIAEFCNKVYTTNNDEVNPWGVLMRTTCKPGEGEEVPVLSIPPNTSNNQLNKLLMADISNSDISTFDTSNKVKNKAIHFWFYGTDSRKLFKPVTYARVFVFNDDTEGNQKITQAQQQVQGGNHYLGFDTGVFNGVYPTMVLNINHRTGKNGKLQSSFNIENEVKKSLPVGKKIFIQFIVQNSASAIKPGTFDTAKYAYLVFKNEDNKTYPHYKIDLSDNNLGYQGHNFYYAN